MTTKMLKSPLRYPGGKSRALKQIEAQLPPAVRELYQDWAHIIPWSLQYGMNNYKQGSAAKGAELFIRNYEVI